MERDKVLIGGLKIGALMRVCILGGDDRAGMVVGCANGKDLSAGGESIGRFAADAGQDLEGAGAAGVIVDRTALAGTLADDEKVIPCTAGKEVTAVMVVVEADGGAEIGESETRVMEELGKFRKRSAALQRVQVTHDREQGGGNGERRCATNGQKIEEAFRARPLPYWTLAPASPGHGWHQSDWSQTARMVILHHANLKTDSVCGRLPLASTEARCCHVSGPSNCAIAWLIGFLFC